MKKGYTEIIFIWDKSGSMQNVYDDALGGFNSFIKSQQEDQDNTKVTLVLFDNEIENKFDSKPIAEIKEFKHSDYILGGMTSLMDAIGMTMNRVGKRFSDLDESERPENVIMVIQTDGQENSSIEFTNKQIQDMIKIQENDYHWQIVYLGANQSAFSSSNNIGLSADAMVNYEGFSTQNAFVATSNRIKDMKRGLNIKSMETYLQEEK